MRYLLYIAMIAGSLASCSGVDQPTLKGSDAKSQSSHDEKTVSNGSSSVDLPKSGEDSEKKDIPLTPEADCLNGSQLTLSTALTYPARSGCEWEKGLNLKRSDSFVQAHETQKVGVSIPADAVICSANLTSEASSFRYYDMIVFTLANHVLFSSAHEPIKGLANKSNTYVWDFTKIAGVPSNLGSGIYCLNEKSKCSMPSQGRDAAVSIDLDTTAFTAIAKNAVDNNSLDFALITTGDDNDNDCSHSGLEFKLDLKYVISK